MRRLTSIFWLGLGLSAVAETPAPWKQDWVGLLQPVALAATAAPSQAAPPPAAAVPSAPAPVVPVPAEPPRFITPDQVLSALRDELVAHYDLEGELHLETDTPLTSLKVPDESWYVEVLPPLPSSLGARLHLRYRLTNGFLPEPEQTIALRCEWWREAIVSNRLLRPGELDLNGAYTIEKVNWLQYRGDLIPVEADLSQLRLKATWRANEPLRWSTVETRPMIEEGKMVEVLATEGALRISMRGVALENGNEGDVIAVRNLQSRKEIQGIVTHANTVLVKF